MGSNVDVDFHWLTVKTSEEFVRQVKHFIHQQKEHIVQIKINDQSTYYFEVMIVTDVKFYMLRFWYLDGAIKVKESNPMKI